MAEYICAGCGTAYDEKDPPCTQCAGERFARIEDDDRVPDRVSGTVDIEWRCKSCSAIHVKNNPPCSRCGNMQYEAVYGGTGGEDPDTIDEPEVNTGPRRITGVKIVTYLFGLQAVAWMVIVLWTSLVASGLFAVAGAFSMPITRRQTERRFNFELSTGAIWLIVSASYFLAWVATAIGLL